MSDAGILVLGAGPAGLGFAQRYGPGCTVLEKTAAVGGLSRSIVMGEGVFDLGGHSFHTPHPEVRDLVRDLMGDNWHEQARDARVWAGGALIPYPFQQHFGQLPDARMVADCAGHVPDPAQIAASADFEAWIHNRFGRGVAEHFMLPYNRKLWARDLRDMACGWVGQRVAIALSSGVPALPVGRQPLQADSLVGYPRVGGFGAIFEAMAKRCPHVEFGQEVVSIDIHRRLVTTGTGNVRPYRSIISTLPLSELLKRLSSCPVPLIRQADRLEAVSLRIVMLLVTLKHADVPQRVYIADPAIPAHKIAFNHRSSPDLAARPHHAITAEISYSAYKPPPPDDRLVETTMDWLIARGFVSDPGQLLAHRVVDVPFGYPVDTLDRSMIVTEITDHLATLDISSIGRFGAWDYANSDECIRQGIELADRMKTSACGDEPPRASHGQAI